ncbi:MAG: hypothetical protein DI535_21880 [Citrobacter freundii]|jgi:hypothetical protein|nr:MAG: hypothetical protein BGP13_18775 [Sphingobacteriales bacterium 40-81]PZR24537.1 MAG: hypothetical protein DI535_21880 [Citrobacter freundii]
MNTLNPIIFLVPVIALILVVLLLLYLLKKVDNKEVFKRFVVITLVLAFLFNLAWEVLQMPLYKDAPFNIQHIAFCALASVADAIMVLLIYFCFALIYKNPLWVQEFTMLRILILMLVGGIGAILAEMRHLSLGNWAYDKSMPLIPVIKVGISPVLQFMILPALIYYLSFKVKNYG